MTVYVDDMRAPFGRMVMCHCWADTRDELFAMMDRIGVQRKWFQRPDGDCDFGMNASWEHFDIAWSKRALAIKAGAMEVSQFTMAEHANQQNFIKHCQRGNMERAFYALRMMTLAHASQVRRS
jgi:hypothetical protein